MANIIQIKSGSGKPGNGKLYPNELGYDTSGGYLYIGNASKEATGIKVDYATKAGSADSATSAKTAESATTAAGLSNTLPITKGGTGATDAASARSKLGFTLANLGINASATELNYVKGVTSGIQAQINSNKTAASNAQATANTATTAASNAQSTANTAQASANTAQGRADSAYQVGATAQASANTAQYTADNALPKAGGTITGVLKHEQNHYVHQATNNQSSDAYCKIATIKIIADYINQEIYFKIVQRGNRIANVYIRYYNSSGTNPGLQFFETDNQNFWLVPEATSTWGLYAYCSAWDSVDVVDFSTGAYNAKKMTVTWTNVSTSSLPSGAVLASTRPLPSRYYGTTLPSSAPAGAIFFKKV